MHSRKTKQQLEVKENELQILTRRRNAPKSEKTRIEKEIVDLKNEIFMQEVFFATSSTYIDQRTCRLTNNKIQATYTNVP